MSDESWDDFGTSLAPEDILGTRTFEDVLYTGETDVVNVLSGETPARLDRSVEDAKQFAAGIDVTDTPQVAKKQPPERAIEGSSPYTACAFYHYSITGGLDTHQAYRAARALPAFDVEFTADYETGDLTITVERVEDAGEP